ncbi:MAG: LysM peptidoglycan-binding domain-containing protein [Dehalococcoidia bacterium]|nr:MAG: LysM peptidoglycan-binding domain-containing protein [Dehalococcoidia bacterium]
MLRDNPPRVDRVYTVQPGDTLGYIAAAYGTTVSALMKKNGITNPNYIWIGQSIIVPA